MGDTRLKIRVLGPLEVVGRHGRVSLGGPKQRTVLALLLAVGDRPVSVDELIDGVWMGEPTSGARSTLQTYVSNLRTALGEVIERQGDGYRLMVERSMVDASQFEDGVAQARRLIEIPTARMWAYEPSVDVWSEFGG